MNIAVVGLGIIGGSFCKAIKKYTDHRVIGINRTKSTAEKALKKVRLMKSAHMKALKTQT